MSHSKPLIVHVIYAFGTGGMENGLVNIINRMPEDQYRHAIVCLTRALGFEQRITASNVDIFELHGKEGHDLGLYLRLWRLLRKLDPAIVHTRNLAALEMQLVAFFSCRAKRVHGEHGRDIYDLKGENRKYNRLRRFMRRFIDRYVAVSKDLDDWLVNTIGVDSSRVIQIYNGVDSTRFCQAESTEKNLPPGFADDHSLVIGSVGRLAAVKDQASLVKALQLLVSKAPENRQRFRMLMVGDGPSRSTLEQQITDAGLADICWLPGDRSDVPELLQAMDIFVLPSLGEGVSNTILEAMASGLPIVATDVGGNPELVQPGVNGMLVEVQNPQMLADCIETLANDPKRLSSMGQAGLARVNKTFNWEQTVSNYAAMYDELLGYEKPLLIN